jgi:hypothetical protein
MSFIASLQALLKKPSSGTAPMRTPTPLRLSQDSALAISITPLILAEAAGALFKSDFPTDHTVVAVGQMKFSGLTWYRVYLSQPEGSFVHLAAKGNDLLETRLYRVYDAIPRANEPAMTQDDWEFWLAGNRNLDQSSLSGIVASSVTSTLMVYGGNPVALGLKIGQKIWLKGTRINDDRPFTILSMSGDYNRVMQVEPAPVDMIVPCTSFSLLAEGDGFIGMPIMPSRDSDGSIPYQRTWEGGNQRVDPYQLTETVRARSGQITTVQHRLMHYGRALTDPTLAEYLMVSATEDEESAGVNLWLGIDLAATDLTVFAAHDAPNWP